LTANYEGYIVYKEIAGELCAYNPKSEWEDKVNQLYIAAQQLEKKSKKLEKEDKREESKYMKESWLQRMKEKWGL